MNTFRILTIVGGLCATGLLGCALDAGHEGFDEGLDDAPLVEREGETTGVCNRRVHIIRDATAPLCANVGSWVGEPLFDVGTPWLAEVDEEPVPDELARYCQYTWNGGGEPSNIQIANLYDHLGSDVLSPSCQAITAQGDVLTDALGSTLRDIFRVGAGRPSSADLGLPTTGAADPEVTVLVIDSQSGALGVQPTIDHGRHMGNIIADIACPDDDPSCLVEVEYVVGLPRVAGGEAKYVQGGIVGTHADLAAAIYQGLRQWDLSNATRAVPTKLVINLSVGWEPEVFGGNEDDPPDAIEAVRSALELASCRGVLVIGSAGNQGDFCDVSGALLPGGWEARPAPDDARCAELGVTIGAPLGSYRPLVHAVGGLGIDLGPMPTARVDANPRLLAASSHVAAGEPIRGGLTGTSVGTAVTSAAAALVWSYRPELSAHEVMDWVYDGGEPLPSMTTHFAIDGTTPVEPHRVDACMALDAACDDPEAACPSMPLSCLGSVAPPLTELSSVLATQAQTLGMGPPFEVSLPDVDDTCMDSCDDPVEIQVAAGGAANCAALDVDPVEGLVNPTPDSIGCPTCTIQNGVLSLSLHSDFAGEAIDSVLVTLTDDQGNTRRYDIGAPKLDSTTRTDVELDPPLPGVVRSGEVTIDFTYRRTTTDALLVL